jgi:hypothetical protein
MRARRATLENTMAPRGRAPCSRTTAPWGRAPWKRVRSWNFFKPGLFCVKLREKDHFCRFLPPLPPRPGAQCTARRDGAAVEVIHTTWILVRVSARSQREGTRLPREQWQRRAHSHALHTAPYQHVLFVWRKHADSNSTCPLVINADDERLTVWVAAVVLPVCPKLVTPSIPILRA